MKELFNGVYELEGKIVTENLTPGLKVYGERLYTYDEKELRQWNPTRSKISAAILNGLKTLPFNSDSKVLYLGAASGTTASHLSDVAKDGTIFCIENSSVPMNNLIELCKKRKNMIPAKADANMPENYLFLLEKVDIIYQDVAQKSQVEILIKNSEIYLKEKGMAMLALKAKSIDSTKDINSVISDIRSKLKEHFKIIQIVDLAPYEKDHAIILLEKKI